MVKAKAAPLSAGHEEDRHLAAPQRFLTKSPGFNRVGFGGDHRHRLDALRRRHRVGMVAVGIQAAQLPQVEATELIEQAALLRRGEAHPASERVLLAELAQTLLEVHGDGEHV